jgi:predicted class III extradiol MEMO1 family dioxygenase
MKTFLNQQLREKDERIAELIQDLMQEKTLQEINEQSKEIMCGIQE